MPRTRRKAPCRRRVFPDGDGSGRIKRVARDQLINFLTHQLNEAHFVLDTGWLRLWHVCVSLLEQLGHQPEGDIDTGVDCHCGACERRDRRLAGFDVCFRRMQAEGRDWGDFERFEDLTAYFAEADEDVLIMFADIWRIGHRGNAASSDDSEAAA